MSVKAPGNHRPLQGCKACITQYNTVEERTRLPELLMEAGASYTADLYKDCTHLLAKVPMGEKYKYAKSWGNIHIVSSAWLEDSLRLGVRQEEAKYAVQASQTGSRSRGRGDGGRDSAEPQHARHDPQPSFTAGTTTSSIQQPRPPGVPPLAQATAAPQARTRGSTHTAGGTGPAQSNTSGGGAPANGRVLPNGLAANTDPGATTTHGAAYNGNAPHVHCGGGGGDELGHVHRSEQGAGAGLYMDFVRYHPVGVAGAENLEARRLVSQCGALREASLVHRVTHILVGSEPSNTELQSVRDHMSEWRDQVKVVRLQWLRDCVGLGRYIEPDASSCLTAAALMPKGQVPLMSASSLRLNGVNPSSSASREPWGSTSSASMDPWDADTRSHAAVDPEPPLPPEQGRALQGLAFTLAAVKGTEAEHIAGRLIRSQGGMLLGSHSIRLIDCNRVYAICPHGMPEVVMSELCRSCEEFRLVPKGQRGTLLWLQECLRTLRLVPPNVYGQPAFHPMPFYLPIKSFENMRVHVSGYSPDMRAAITTLVEILGGKVTQDFCKVNTHLLVANASGKKYEAAVKWGVPAVSEMWIINSAYSGQPCDAWIPKARPKGETEGMMQAAIHQFKARQAQQASAFSNSSQSSHCEQLPGTQFAGTQQPPLMQRSLPSQHPSGVSSGATTGSVGATAVAAGHNSNRSRPNATGGAPKKRMGLVEALDSISDAEENVPPPNREVTFTGSGFRVINSSDGQQAMPPPPPRQAQPNGLTLTDANGGVLAPPQTLDPQCPSLQRPHLQHTHDPTHSHTAHVQHHQVQHTREHLQPAGQTAAARVVCGAGAAMGQTGYEGSVSGGEKSRKLGERQPGLDLHQQQQAAGFAAEVEGDQGSGAMDGSQPGDEDPLEIAQIHRLLQEAKPAGGLDGNCSQFDEPLLTGVGGTGLPDSTGLTGAEQQGGATGGPTKWGVGESLVSVGGGGGREMSHTSAGGNGTRGTDGDAVSKPARRKRGAAAMEPPPPSAHPTHKLRQRGMIVTCRESETQEDALQMEMSQQVGYDAGQQASERLTRNRSRSTNNCRGSTAGGMPEASEAQAAAKMSFISRLRQKG